MKCVVCNEVFEYETAIDIIMVQEICNKCYKLFKYAKKNVKINNVVIRVNYFLFYENIRLFLDEVKKDNINKFIIKKKVNGEIYDLKMIKTNMICLNKKRLIIVFYREEFNELKKALQILINTDKKLKIKCYELLSVNTKKTQTNG